MDKIRKGDIVQAIKGKDRGKRGKVLRFLRAENRVFVEGINLVKKHRRRTQQDQQGKVVSIEAAMSLANIMLFCKHCNRPVRIGITIMNDGTKSRHCKVCKETI